MMFENVYHFANHGLSACYYQNGENLEIWRYHDVPDKTWNNAVSFIKTGDYISAMGVLDEYKVGEEV